MADQKIRWYILSPQLIVTAPGTPVQISATRLIARTVLIYADKNNVGTMFLADSAAKIAAGNCVKIDAGEWWELHPDNFDNIDQFVNLTEWYWDGTDAGDRFVVEILWKEE